MRSGATDFLLGEFWAAVRDRLDTATMQASTKGNGRVYVLGIDPLPPTGGAEGEDWKRVVIVPAQTLWPGIEGPGESTGIAWLVRAETNDLVASGYTPNIGLELMQREAGRRLDGWLPTAGESVQVVLPVYRHRRPQAVPLRDAERGMLVTSSEFRTQVAGVAAVSP